MGSNLKTIKYLYDGLDIIQEIEGSSVTNYVRTLNIDEPLARIKADGTIRHYQTDALGSVIALVDDTGAVKTTYTYDPFGNVTVSGEASDNPFQYTGRENDGTGLYYYRARYYSPELQRFISEDPIGLAGGDVNYFAYVGNNSVNRIDPLGLFCVPVWRSVTGYEYEVWREYWKLAGSKVISADLWWGYCQWHKIQKGWMKKYIRITYLCCDECSGCYTTTKDITEEGSYERVVDVRVTKMKFWPVGPYHMYITKCLPPS